jgi:hypothetical protein
MGNRQSRAAKPTQLRLDMRRLWQDHVVWTRDVILGIMDDLPGLDEATARLLRNQDDIGDAIKPYYGAAAGDELARLLRLHISTAADVLKAAKSGNGLAGANAAWQANADDIAAFLARANPLWREADLQRMMRRHLQLTTDEAVARKTRDYAAGVAAYDGVRAEIAEMADMLADGIARQKAL